MILNIRFRQNWNEPEPRKYSKIHCFDCKKDLANKRSATQHRGHYVEYLDENGEVMR